MEMLNYKERLRLDLCFRSKDERKESKKMIFLIEIFLRWRIKFIVFYFINFSKANICKNIHHSKLIYINIITNSLFANRRFRFVSDLFLFSYKSFKFEIM